MTQTLTLPWLPANVSNGPHGNYLMAAKQRAQNRHKTAILVKLAGLHPVQSYPVTIETEWTFKQRRRRDADGLIARLKSCIDALRDTGILEEDTVEHVQWGRVSVVIGTPIGVVIRLVEAA